MSDLMLRDFFDDDFFGFGLKPLSMHFATPYTKDMTPFAPWKKDEDGNYFTVCRMIGIDPDGVELSLESYGIHVHGESDTFGEKYSQDLKLGVGKDTLANVEAVNYEVKNGMCKITLIMKAIEKKEVKINRI